MFLPLIKFISIGVSTVCKSAFLSFATCLIVLKPLFEIEVATVEFSFIMPAFSKAICSKEFPNLSVWSNEIEVITDNKGFFIVLVASYLPPKPVSIIAISTLLSAKYLKAEAVKILYNVF